MANPLETSDIVLKDEGPFFEIIANTELGRILKGDRETIKRKEVRAFIKKAEERGITVFEF